MPVDQEAVSVAVVDTVPAYRAGVTAAFTGAGFHCPGATDALDRVLSSQGRRALLITIRSGEQWALLDLHGHNCPTLVVVALLTDRSPAGHREAFRAGACSAVPFDAPVEQILAVLRAALDQHVLLPVERPSPRRRQSQRRRRLGHRPGSRLAPAAHHRHHHRQARRRRRLLRTLAVPPAARPLRTDAGQQPHRSHRQGLTAGPDRPSPALRSALSPLTVQAVPTRDGRSQHAARAGSSARAARCWAVPCRSIAEGRVTREYVQELMPRPSRP